MDEVGKKRFAAIDRIAVPFFDSVLYFTNSPSNSFSAFSVVVFSSLNRSGRLNRFASCFRFQRARDTAAALPQRAATAETLGTAKLLAFDHRGIAKGYNARRGVGRYLLGG